MKWLRRKPARTSYLWCYACHHDLNGDDASFTGESDNIWTYSCQNCGSISKFSLDYPIPVRIYP